MPRPAKFAIGQIVYDKSQDGFWKVVSRSWCNYTGEPKKWWYRLDRSWSQPSMEQADLRALTKRERGESNGK